MTTIIFGSTYSRAKNKFCNYIGEMQYKNIDVVRKSSYEYEARLVNGDIIVAKPIGSNCRGMRAEHALVDSMIDKEVVDTLILPIVLINKEFSIKFFDN